jgi:hypothetical protein
MAFAGHRFRWLLPMRSASWLRMKRRLPRNSPLYSPEWGIKAGYSPSQTPDQI